MTVHEAWALAKPLAESLDQGAILLLVTSGTGLQGNGRSAYIVIIYAHGERR
jgi:hypothetical protein